MRKWILNIHLYGGLLCSSYLIIFGISSLQFNHRFGFMKPSEQKVKWERDMPVHLVKDDGASAERVRDSLGLVGWPLPWETRRETNGDLRFGMSRPGKNYTIVAQVKENRVQVEEQRQGVWPVINSLHGFSGVPKSRFAAGWLFYTDFCAVVVLFSACSGIYLWAAQRRERLAGVMVLGAAVACSIGLMLYARWGA
jgi:hypothetical protein